MLVYVHVMCHALFLINLAPDYDRACQRTDSVRIIIIAHFPSFERTRECVLHLSLAKTG